MKAIELLLVALCLALVPPTTAPAQGSARSKTAPAQSKEEELLKRLMGSWEGTARTWVHPNKLIDEYTRSIPPGWRRFS